MDKVVNRGGTFYKNPHSKVSQYHFKRITTFER